MKLSLFALALVASSAFAVTTRNCPQSLYVNYSQLRLSRSLPNVLTEVGASVADGDDEEVQSITAAWANLAAMGDVVRDLPLASARNGRCVYRAGNSVEKIELYTSRGRDLLLLQTEIGPRGILARIYANLATISATGVTLTTASAGLALAIPRYPYSSYDAGGPLVFVGKALDVTTTEAERD